MNNNEHLDVINLINQARTELEKAGKTLDCLKANPFFAGAEETLDIIDNYITRSKELVSWLKNAASKD